MTGRIKSTPKGKPFFFVVPDEPDIGDVYAPISALAVRGDQHKLDEGKRVEFELVLPKPEKGHRAKSVRLVSERGDEKPPVEAQKTAVGSKTQTAVPAEPPRIFQDKSTNTVMVQIEFGPANGNGLEVFVQTNFADVYVQLTVRRKGQNWEATEESSTNYTGCATFLVGLSDDENLLDFKVEIPFGDEHGKIAGKKTWYKRWRRKSELELQGESLPEHPQPLLPPKLEVTKLQGQGGVATFGIVSNPNASCSVISVQDIQARELGEKEWKQGRKINLTTGEEGILFVEVQPTTSCDVWFESQGCRTEAWYLASQPPAREEGGKPCQTEDPKRLM